MKTKAPASANIIKFNALLRELFPYNHAEAKEGILSGYEVTSTLDLAPAQLAETIEGLEKEKAKRRTEPDRETRQLRSKCLGLMTDIGINTSDWAKVNAFCEKPQVLNGRRLYDLDKEQLEAFRKKLFAIKVEYARRTQDEKHWATHN